MLCATRPAGRRHGVCGLALSGERLARVSATEEGRWAFCARLDSLRSVFVSARLPVRGAPIDTLDAALNDLARQVQRVTQRDDKVIIMGDMNCKFSWSDACTIASFVPQARIPDTPSKRIVAWMCELGLKCVIAFFELAASRSSWVGQSDTAIDHILAAGA